MIVLNCDMSTKLKWFIYLFIVFGTAIGVGYSSSDAGFMECLLVGLGNGVFNFLLVERVFKKE